MLRCYLGGWLLKYRIGHTSKTSFLNFCGGNMSWDCQLETSGTTPWCGVGHNILLAAYRSGLILGKGRQQVPRKVSPETFAQLCHRSRASRGSKMSLVDTIMVRMPSNRPQAVRSGHSGYLGSVPTTFPHMQSFSFSPQLCHAFHRRLRRYVEA